MRSLKKVWEYNGSYLGFKNCIDKWIGEIPNMPREVGNEPLGRNANGKLSNSVKDWRKIHVYSKYDNSWVPVRKQKAVLPEI